MFREVQTRYSNTVVCHSIVNVEATRHTQVVSPIDARWKDDICHCPLAFFGQFRCQHRLRRTILDEMRMTLRKHEQSRRVAQLASWSRLI
jgi:hypothetical protein